MGCRHENALREILAAAMNASDSSEPEDMLALVTSMARKALADAAVEKAPCCYDPPGPAEEMGPDGRMHVFDCAVLMPKSGPCDGEPRTDLECDRPEGFCDDCQRECRPGDRCPCPPMRSKLEDST